MGTHLSKDQSIENFGRRKSLRKQFKKSFKNVKSQRKTEKWNDTSYATSIEATDSPKVSELETELSEESNNVKDEEIGLIIAELVLSTYGRKNRSKRKVLSDVCSEKLYHKDDVLISLDDSKDVNERRSKSKRMVPSLTILDIEDASDSTNETDTETHTDIDTDTDTDSAYKVYNTDENALIRNSIEPEHKVASDKTDESEKEDVQGLFPAVTADEAIEQINQHEILPGCFDIQEYEICTDTLAISNNEEEDNQDEMENLVIKGTTQETINQSNIVQQKELNESEEDISNLNKAKEKESLEIGINALQMVEAYINSIENNLKQNMSNIEYFQEDDDDMNMNYCTCREFVRNEQPKMIYFEPDLDIHEEDEEDIELEIVNSKHEDDQRNDESSSLLIINNLLNDVLISIYQHEIAFHNSSEAELSTDEGFVATDGGEENRDYVTLE